MVMLSPTLKHYAVGVDARVIVVVVVVVVVVALVVAVVVVVVVLVAVAVVALVVAIQPQSYLRTSIFRAGCRGFLIILACQASVGTVPLMLGWGRWRRAGGYDLRP